MVVLPASAAVSNPRETNETRPAADASAFQAVLSRTAPDGTTLVSPVKTNLDADQASAALKRAWTDVFGEEPSPRTVGILTAQWAHETASGASMYNYNFAGIKGTGPSGFSVAQRTTEGYGRTEHRIVDRFRAYTTAEEGATDYVKLLASRFPEATEAAKNGSAEGFVHALRARSYFTGDEAAYTRAVVAFAGRDPASESGGVVAPRLDYGPATNAPAGGFDFGGFGHGMAETPFVSSLALADELSRTALGIAASPTRGRRSGDG